MVLHILDVNNYMYAGSFFPNYIQRGVREDNGEYISNEAPIGGVAFLIREIGRLLKDKDAVIMAVFDSTPTIKREMYYETFGLEYGYKSGRKSKPAGLNDQIDYAEEILRDMGVIVQRVEGYEADDIIHTITLCYKDDFDHIYIHTKDSDLFYLVSEHVSIDYVGTKGKHIDIYNYNVTCKKDEFTPYNTVHLRKLVAGDVSDNIPGVGQEWAKLIDGVMQPDEYRLLGDLDFARKKLKDAITANPTQPGGHNLLRIFNIVCPLQVPYEFLNDDEQMINFDKLSYYIHDWNTSEDIWGLEDMLLEYIETYYR